MFSWTLHGDGKKIAAISAVAPDERLTYPRTIGIGLQHVLAMMGSTLVVPAITGMPAATTLFFSAIGTALFLTITQNRVPSYLGSSFAFIAPLAAAGVNASYGALDAATIARGLGGIVLAGALLAIIGAIVNFAGVKWIEKVMPPVVTGAIVALIGLNLASAAKDLWVTSPWTALVTLAAVLLSMVVFRGFMGRIAILLGAVIGVIFSMLRGEWSTPSASLGDKTPFEYIGAADWFGMPTFHTPTFDGSVLVAFIPVVLILVAENVGHVKSVAAMTNRNLDDQTGKALFADGVATVVAGVGGGSGTTTYAENIGVMAATRVYSTLAYWAAAAFALVLSLVPKFGALVTALPPGILGGLATLLFGLIGMLGARIWVENKVDFTNPINLVTASVALIVGIADYSATAGSMVFNGIALGSIAALLIYHGLGYAAKLRGGAEAPLSVATEPEDISPDGPKKAPKGSKKK